MKGLQTLPQKMYSWIGWQLQVGLTSEFLLVVVLFQNQDQSWIPYQKLHGACVFDFLANFNSKNCQKMQYTLRFFSGRPLSSSVGTSHTTHIIIYPLHTRFKVEKQDDTSSQLPPSLACPAPPTGPIASIEDTSRRRDGWHHGGWLP